MKKEFICIVCPAGCHLSVDDDGNISGYSCDRGLQYAKTELTAPKRVVSSTVRLSGDPGHPRLPVKLDRPVDKAIVKEAVKALDCVVATAPVKTGDVILENVLGSGANFVATHSVG